MIKILEFLIEKIIFLIIFLYTFILVSILSLCLYNVIEDNVLLIFISSSIALSIVSITNFLFLDKIIEIECKIIKKLYRYFNIVERRNDIEYEHINKKLKMNRLKNEINKKQSLEVSPLRGIILKRLEKV